MVRSARRSRLLSYNCIELQPLIQALLRQDGTCSQVRWTGLLRQCLAESYPHSMYVPKVIFLLSTRQTPLRSKVNPSCQNPTL